MPSHFVSQKGYDSIASASTVQWFSEPQAFVAQCAAVMFARAVVIIPFAPQNLQEFGI